MRGARFRAVMALGVAAIVVAACGDDGETTTTTTSAAAQTTAAPSESVAPATDAPASSASDAPGDTGEAPTQTGTVKIGALMSQTGAASAFGADGIRSIELAVEEINETGFVVGDTTYTFDLQVADLQTDANLAAPLAQELVVGFGAKVLFGPDLSGAVDPVVNVVQRQGDTLLMSVATKLDDYVGQGTPIFRTTVPDSVLMDQGYIPAIAREFPDIEQIAFVMPDDALAQDLVGAYVPAFEAVGIEVVQTELFAPETADFLPVMQRISSDVDAIFYGYNNDGRAASVIDAALEVGLPAKFITRGVSSLPGDQRRSDLELYTWTILGDDPAFPSSPEVGEWLDGFADRFGLDRSAVTWFPFSHYDYVYALVAAMQEAGTVDDVDAIGDALRGSTYEGVVTVVYDEDGINQSPTFVGILENGEARVVES